MAKKKKNGAKLSEEEIKRIVARFEDIVRNANGGVAKDILRYAENKAKTPRLVHMYVASDVFTNNIYFKLLDFATILSTAKFNAGGKRVTMEDLLWVMEQGAQIEKRIDDFNTEALEKGIGAAWQLRKLEKEAKKQKQETSDESAKEAETVEV